MIKQHMRNILYVSFILLIAISSSTWAEKSSLEDTDQDGLPDIWELKYFKGDLTIMDKDSDYDGDGISNGVEYQLGTDPTAPNPTGPKISYEYDKLGRLIKIERVPGQ